MGKTVKGKKGPGFDYWGKRPNAKANMLGPGAKAKKITHSIERAQSKRLIKKEKDDYEKK